MTETAVRVFKRFIDVESTDAKSDTLTLSFSSETPVQRNFGTEILSHEETAVDLTRFNDGAPVLWSHDPTQQIGIIQRAWIENKKGYAEIRWGNSERAKEVRADVEDGVIRNVSIGYTIEDMDEDEEGRMIATRWSVMELSFVSVPADPNVGIGRNHPSYSGVKMTQEEMIAKGIIPHPNQIPKVASSNWQEREYQEYKRESSQFSILEALKGVQSGKGLSGREAEINREIEIQSGKRTDGFFVPHNVGWGGMQKRAYTVGTATAGGNLVETDLLESNFIEALRNRTVIGELGARYFPGLVGNVSIPRRTGDNVAYWIGADNSDSITESTGTFDQISMTPKTVGALTKYSHLMKLQSTPEIEQVIRNGFIAIIANAIDSAALNGSGSSNQPTGVLNTTGINSVAGGTNGLAVNLDHLFDLKKSVSIDNADVQSAAFVTNSKVEAALAKLKDGNSQYLLSPYGLELGRQQIASRRLEVTNAIPSNLTKGSGSNLSAVLYGNFADLYVGLFGELEVLVDPFSDFAKGTTAVRILQSIDIAVAHPESFAAMKDAIAA